MSAGAGFICKIHKGESVCSNGGVFSEKYSIYKFSQALLFFCLFVSLLPPFCSGALHWTQNKNWKGKYITAHLFPIWPPHQWTHALGLLVVQHTWDGPCLLHTRTESIVEMVNTDQGVHVREGTEPVHHSHSYLPTNTIMADRPHELSAMLK